jgi:hypothetical protein
VVANGYPYSTTLSIKESTTVKQGKPEAIIMRVTLEPADDAALRMFCQKTGMGMGEAVRFAVFNMMTQCTDDEIKAVPSFKSTYGKLGKMTVTLRMPKNIRTLMHEKFESLGLNGKRFYARFIRMAIRRSYVASSSDAA